MVSHYWLMCRQWCHCLLVPVVGAHMLICIYAQGQSKYISGFSLILLFHHIPFTVTIFLIFFSIFVVVLFTSKSLSFRRGTCICFCLGNHVPACCTESNCTICIACAHLGTLSRVEAGARNWVYVG